MPTEPWREPASLLPLVWGRYADRYGIGLVLIITGAIQLQGSNTYTLPLLLIGTVAGAVGWSILPARGWRRALAVVPGAGSIWMLLIGPQASWTLTISFLCWLVVRHRPPRSYVTAVLPLASGLALAQTFEEYRWMPLALAIQLVVLVASAWIARALATTVRGPSDLAAGTG
jgi:hypothetical protein